MSSKLDREESLALLSEAITRLRKVATALTRACNIGEVSKFYTDLGFKLVTLKIELPKNSSENSYQLDELLAQLEKICITTILCKPGDIPPESPLIRRIYPALWSLVHDDRNYENARNGLWKSTLTPESIVEHTDFLEALRNSYSAEVPKSKRLMVVSSFEEEVKAKAPVLEPNDCHREISSLYFALKECNHCTCPKAANTPTQMARHEARVQLKASYECLEHISRFKILFCALSGSITNLSSPSWQETQVSVIRTSTRQVGFSEDDTSRTPVKPKPVTKSQPMGKQQFCNYIRIHQKTNFRKRMGLCLEVQGKHIVRPTKPFVPRVPEALHVVDAPSVSLATALTMRRLSEQMKLVLAIILAESVWQFYSSDWMNRGWTSKHIHFMYQENSTTGVVKDLFAHRPYFYVSYDDEASEHHTLQDFQPMHLFPKILALGMILLEIGLNNPLEPLLQDSDIEENPNSTYLSAFSLCEDPDQWPEDVFEDYKKATAVCFSNEIFEECDSEEGERAALRAHVIQPLKELFRRAWRGDADSITLSPMNPKGEFRKTEGVLGSQPIPQYIEAPIIDTWKPSIQKDLGLVPSPAFGFHLQKLDLNSESLLGSANWLRQMKETMHPLILQSTIPSREPQRKSSQPRIKIAILDTGYDPTAPDFQAPSIKTRIKGYKGWVGDPLRPQDSNGHGTHATALLLEIAPFADIYIARIAEDNDSLLKVEQNIAEAIKHAALTWEVNIISMSFGFAKDVLEIENAIKEVRYKRDDKILLFAAASNSGGNARETYPARNPFVISIRSTTSEGGFPAYNPHLDGDDKGICFGTLGENVLSAWPCALGNSEGQVCQSGTSVATPIAAGLAAFMLEYVGANSNTNIFDRVWGKLQKIEGMIAIFKLMSSSIEGRRFYIAPWYFFSDLEEEYFNEQCWHDIVAAMKKVK